MFYSAAIIPMCNAMNPGWAFTFMGLVYACLIVVVFVIMKNGMKWRKELAEKKKRRSEEQAKGEVQVEPQDSKAN